MPFNSDTARQAGKKSRKIFEEYFTLDKVVEQTFEIYTQALKS